jgi:hypothetical protein
MENLKGKTTREKNYDETLMRGIFLKYMSLEWIKLAQNLAQS